MRKIAALILFLLAPLACAPTAQAPAPRQADSATPQRAADARLTELENRLNRAAVALAPAQQSRPALYYDANLLHTFNGDNPNWGRAAKTMAGIEGMRPLLVMTLGILDDFNPNEVRRYAAAWADSKLPVIQDHEGKGFSFWLYSPPGELATALKNHMAWNAAWRQGNPKAVIGHWNTIPPPWGTVDPNILKGLAAYEAKCAPLIAAQDFCCFDAYAYNGVSEEQWTSDVLGTLPRAKKFGKPMIVGVCPFVADTGQTLPTARFERMLQGCADGGAEGIFIFTGLADTSAVGDENWAVIQRWAGLSRGR